MIDTEITPGLRAAIETVVRDELDRFGVSEVEVVDAEDHEGGPSILVLVHDADAGPDPKAMAGTVSKVSDRLYQLKDRRFATIAHRVPERGRRARTR